MANWLRISTGCEATILSALARPQNLLLYGEPLDLFDVAASLAFGIMRSHRFQDGNKRSSWIAIQVTLISNGLDNKVHSEEARDKMFDLANKTVGEKGMADWLRKKASAEISVETLATKESRVQ